jgi:glycosyltransferase involved in cell wall biosynthesis
VKVLHLWKSDAPPIGGGGAASMSRLHSNLRKAGVESKILCEIKTTNAAYVAVKPGLTRTERYIKRVTSKLGLNDIHRISSYTIKRHPAYLESDIIHFHGIHGGFISYLALPSLTENKPAIFTLRDMWCLTGHCAYSFDCDRWKTGCGRCPYPDAHPAIERDGTRMEWKLKNWAYKRSNLTIVSPSSWLAEQAKKSMLNRFSIFHIPNGVDTEVYEPLDSIECRSVLKIPRDKRVLMFSSIDVNDWRKGGDLLAKALQDLPDQLKAQVMLLILGLKGERLAAEVGIEALSLGYVSSDRLKAIAYSAADVFLLPTRADNLPLTILESFACGTPVISFRVGGVPELVRPGITGYLAEPENSNDLCKEIMRLLEDEYLGNQMRRPCRSIVMEKYSVELEVQRYTDLYNSILNQEINGR